VVGPPRRPVVSLKPTPFQPVPEETVRIARAAFRKGNPQSWLGKFGQIDRWSFCLTAARMAREQERR
jgi:hypothetical protein